MVVLLDVESSNADGEQPGTEWVGVEVGVDVGGVDDRCQTNEGGVIAEVKLVNENFEAALGAAMAELGAVGIETPRALSRGNGENVDPGDVEDLRVGVDEALNEPGASNAIGLRSRSRNPFHGVSDRTELESPQVTVGV